MVVAGPRPAPALIRQDSAQPSSSASATSTCSSAQHYS